MKLKEKLSKERFEQVLGSPLSGKYHTPQEARPVYEKGFLDGFAMALELAIKEYRLSRHQFFQRLESLGEEEVKE
jgi:hypothetical protein